jgi:hypothetical protein
MYVRNFSQYELCSTIEAIPIIRRWRRRFCMHRVAAVALGTMLLIGSFCYGQSLADAARANRKQKADAGSSTEAAAKVLTSDDLSANAQVTLHLVPGASSTGDGGLIAPGRWKHRYSVTYLDLTKFANGGVLHLTITVGGGAASEASFDLFSEGARLPSDGFPNPLASVHNIPSGGSGKLNYHFDHGGVFQLGAEGSWNAKAGDENTYSFVAEVANR